MYNDVQHFVTTCESCQVHSGIRHRDELHPTYPLTILFKWMVDLVTMSMGVGQMRYVVLARENVTNHEKGQALTKKTIIVVFRFLLENMIYWYGCVGKIKVDTHEVRSCLIDWWSSSPSRQPTIQKRIGRSSEGMDQSSKPSYGHATVESGTSHNYYPIPCGPIEPHTIQ